MFDELGRRLEGVLGRFTQRGVLTESAIREGLREVRLALLEADVNFQVVRDFLRRVQGRALGERVTRSVSPGQEVVKIVHEELARLLGEGDETALQWSPAPPSVFILVGLQGAGKTTTAAKLARRLAGQGKRVLLAACDVHRPAAVEQLVVMGRRAEVPVHAEPGAEDALGVAVAAHRRARSERIDALIVDTAGRLQIDEPMMEELERLAEAIRPRESLLVADAMTGQEAVRIAVGFGDRLGLTGFVLTKLDGDARGGAALSIRAATGRPLKFVGTGEGLDDLEEVEPRRMAGRILGKGDVVALVDRARAAAAAEGARLNEAAILGKRTFDLADFLVAMRQLQRMGPLEQIARMIPGLPRSLPLGAADPKKLKHMEAIILSMTPGERRRPEILNGSRRRRIARGSGRPVSEVNRLLKRFEQMRGMLGAMQRSKPPRMR
ncbi:MAG: signal recognition particle protein [Gemmatimonadetes bacterium]|nr:signal recognition particle protein [Gemmatimonadota bacterium]MCY3942480.1 signal recognition particle protein [Gemmatimonadota bacterium]